MSRRHHRTAGLIAVAVAAGQLMTPGNAWAATTAAPAVAVSAVGTVTSIRTADSTMVVTRAYLFRDSRPKTVKFTLTTSTAVVVNGSAGTIGAVRAGMQVAVTGAQTGAVAVASRIVVRR